jgi:hypothetical protein
LDTHNRLFNALYWKSRYKAKKNNFIHGTTVWYKKEDNIPFQIKFLIMMGLIRLALLALHFLPLVSLKPLKCDTASSPTKPDSPAASAASSDVSAPSEGGAGGNSTEASGGAGAGAAGAGAGGAAAGGGGSILFDGRFNTYKTAKDLDGWSNAKRDGEYQTYIHGHNGVGVMSTYVKLGPDFKNPADSLSKQGAQITIDDTSQWKADQFFRRTELIPETKTSAMDTNVPAFKGVLYFHFSMAPGKRPANLKHEHQLVFFEAHFIGNNGISIRTALSIPKTFHIKKN